MINFGRLADAAVAARSKQPVAMLARHLLAFVLAVWRCMLDFRVQLRAALQWI